MGPWRQVTVGLWPAPSRGTFYLGLLATFSEFIGFL